MICKIKYDPKEKANNGLDISEEEKKAMNLNRWQTSAPNYKLVLSFFKDEDNSFINDYEVASFFELFESISEMIIYFLGKLCIYDRQEIIFQIDEEYENSLNEKAGEATQYLYIKKSLENICECLNTNFSKELINHLLKYSEFIDEKINNFLKKFNYGEE